MPFQCDLLHFSFEIKVLHLFEDCVPLSKIKYLFISVIEAASFEASPQTQGLKWPSLGDWGD